MVVSRSDRRFALAADLGATTTHAVRDAVGLTRAARDFSGREGVDLVVETAGTPEAVAHALDLVRPGGRVVLTGLPHEPTPIAFFGVVRREVTILGSMIYQEEFGEALALVASGAVRGEALHRDPDSIKVAVTVVSPPWRCSSSKAGASAPLSWRASAWIRW